MQPSPLSVRARPPGFCHFRGHHAFTFVTARRLAPMPRMGLSMGFRSLGFPPACHPATGLPIITPTGLTPAGHSSLFWTHNCSWVFRSQAALQWPTLTPKTVSAFRISRTWTSWSSDHLSPFAMWTALPSADYYGDSVALGLASRRRSRVPLVLNVSSVT